MRNLSTGLAGKEDLPGILRIESDLFGDDAWIKRDFESLIRHSETQLRVVRSGVDVVAYIAYEFHDNGTRIINFAVERKRQRQGIGKWMMSLHLFMVSRSERLWVRCAVRENNLPMQKLLQASGFHTESIIRRPIASFDGDCISFRVIPAQVSLTKIGDGG